jgi:hypothetical protein
MDELILGEVGELGPLDTQLYELREGETGRYTSALNSFKALNQIRQYTLETFDLSAKLILSRSGMRMKDALELATELSAIVSNPLISQMNPRRIGESSRALDIGLEYGKRILERYRGFTSERAKDILQQLIYGYPNHRFILDVDELNYIGLKAGYPRDNNEKHLLNELRKNFIFNSQIDITKLFEPKKVTKNVNQKNKKGGKSSDSKKQ